MYNSLFFTTHFILQVIAGMARLLASGLVQSVVVELSPQFWGSYGITRYIIYFSFCSFFKLIFVLNLILSLYHRLQVANVVTSNLYNNGYTKITVFGYYQKPDREISGRQELFDYILTGQKEQQDFHFRK